MLQCMENLIQGCVSLSAVRNNIESLRQTYNLPVTHYARVIVNKILIAMIFLSPFHLWAYTAKQLEESSKAVSRGIVTDIKVQ